MNSGTTKIVALGILPVVAALILFSLPPSTPDNGRTGSVKPAGHDAAEGSVPASSGAEAVSEETSDQESNTLSGTRTDLKMLTSEERSLETDEDFRKYSLGQTVSTKKEPCTWKVGDSWSVRTYYRQMQSPRDGWSREPILWNFKVAGFSGGHYQIEVWTDDNVEGLREAVVNIRPDHRIVSMQDRVREQGEDRIRQFEYIDATCTTMTVIPFELPPVEAAATALKSRTPVSLPDPLFAEPEVEVKESSGDVVDVEFTNLFDGADVVQRWDSAEPRWPVYSRTETRVSYLVR